MAVNHTEPVPLPLCVAFSPADVPPPQGAARFKDLVESEFFGGVRFFRVISGFMAQFGISGNPEISAYWRNQKLKDDPVVVSQSTGRTLVMRVRARVCVCVLLRC